MRGLNSISIAVVLAILCAFLPGCWSKNQAITTPTEVPLKCGTMRLIYDTLDPRMRCVGELVYSVLRSEGYWVYRSRDPIIAEQYPLSDLIAVIERVDIRDLNTVQFELGDAADTASFPPSQIRLDSNAVPSESEIRTKVLGVLSTPEFTSFMMNAGFPCFRPGQLIEPIEPDVFGACAGYRRN